MRAERSNAYGEIKLRRLATFLVFSLRRKYTESFPLCSLAQALRSSTLTAVITSMVAEKNLNSKMFILKRRERWMRVPSVSLFSPTFPSNLFKKLRAFNEAGLDARSMHSLASALLAVCSPFWDNVYQCVQNLNQLNYFPFFCQLFINALVCIASRYVQ